MKISTQAAKNPTLAEVSVAVIRAIGGGKRSNSGTSTQVQPNSKFPGMVKAIENSGIAFVVLGYKLVGAVETSNYNFNGSQRISSVRATYTNGVKTFKVATYVGCGMNFEVREVKKAA